MNLYTMAEAANNYSSAGAGKTKLPTLKMLLLGILAGFLIGVPSIVTNMATYTVVGNSTVRMISGILFAFGLGTVILTGAELFTGNTLILISVLDKKATAAGMLRNWIVVYLGNFIGSLILSFICARFGWLNAANGDTANALAIASMKVAQGKMNMPFFNAFFMGVLCNILVTLGVLMSLAGKDGHCRHDLLHPGAVCQAVLHRRHRLPGAELGQILCRQYAACDAGQRCWRLCGGAADVVLLRSQAQKLSTVIG